MRQPPSQRPPMSDDLDQAYTQAHAMADAGRGPSDTVRANVLAAAQDIATEAGMRARVAPVASPVTAVGRGRRAVNLSSWRLRAGAAFCAALLVGVACWRFDASRRFGEETQLASAALEMDVVPPRPPRVPPPLDLPPPPNDRVAPIFPSAPAADREPVHAAPGQAAPLQAAPSPGPAAKSEARSEDAGVARAEPPFRERAQALAPPVPTEPVATAPTAAVALPAPVDMAALVAPPPARIAATRVMPSPAPKRVVGDAARASIEPASKSSPEPARYLLETRVRRVPTALQAAADLGDLESLKKLLADPATQVDAPDAMGRTALLHAVLAQRVTAVRLLLAAGADPARPDAAGLTPRAAALAAPDGDISALLAEPR